MTPAHSTCPSRGPAVPKERRGPQCASHRKLVPVTVLGCAFQRPLGGLPQISGARPPSHKGPVALSHYVTARVCTRRPCGRAPGAPGAELRCVDLSSETNQQAELAAGGPAQSGLRGAAVFSLTTWMCRAGKVSPLHGAEPHPPSESGRPGAGERGRSPGKPVTVLDFQQLPLFSNLGLWAAADIGSL